MPDFFEIDFLAVETKKSGDAITIRYSIDGKETIHVVDGGFEATGKAIIKHLQEYYGQSGTVNISRVIVTHQDHDHTRGLRTVLEECNVGELWMLRPWIYSNELVDKFKRWTNPDNLSKRLKDIYPNILALEEIANRKGIPIYEPFQGKKIGEFLVLAPSKNRYLDLVAESEKTPDVVATESSFAESLSSIWNSVIHFINANWGDENLSKEPTSAENNMSVVQYASLNEQNILLTGDAGMKHYVVEMSAMISALQKNADFLNQSKQQIIFNITPNITVLGDETQLQSAVSNLIYNAVKHAGDGATIEVDWHWCEEGAEFSVKDNGIGIEDEHLPHLTERFYRVDESRSNQTGGSGLGLAIVKYALEQHGSQLQIKSEFGKGSRFSFIIKKSLLGETKNH